MPYMLLELEKRIEVYIKELGMAEECFKAVEYP